MQAFSNATTEPNFVVSQGTPPSPIANRDPSARRNLSPPALPCQFGRRLGTRTVRGCTNARPLALGSSCARYDVAKQFRRMDPYAIGEGEWSPLTLAWTAVTAKVCGLPWRHFFCSNAEKRESELSGRPTFSQSTGRESPVTPVNFCFPFRSPHDIFAIAGEPSCPSIK